MNELQDILPIPRGPNEPRYQENPIFLFFEEYVLAVIAELDEERIAEIQELDLQRIFGTQASYWPLVVTEVLDLSDTIEVTILDRWIRTRDKFLEHGQRYDPVAFAQDFTDLYTAEGSEVDTWTREAFVTAVAGVGTKLDAARRITRG